VLPLRILLSCPLPRVQSTRCSRLARRRHRSDFERNTPFHEVSDPSTYEVWRSDLHWSYLPQLCCTFRVSHPLGALFRSVPFRPCFMPVTPLGFCRLQRFSPAGSEPCLSAGLVLLSVLSTRSSEDKLDAAASRMCAPGESVSLVQYYLDTRARSAPDVVPFEVFTSSILAPRMTAGPPFMGFVTMPDGRNRPSP
jgi:hypothetical protein